VCVCVCVFVFYERSIRQVCLVKFLKLCVVGAKSRRHTAEG